MNPYEEDMTIWEAFCDVIEENELAMFQDDDYCEDEEF